MADATTEILNRIRGQFRGGKFEPYIDFIQFPNYKNFQKDLRVDFDFPLTVVVGQNGSGKSSLLHALYGAPSGFSPGRWWFGTELDPIEIADESKSKKKLSDSEKAAFWYGYREKGKPREAVKMRIRKPGNPDYWEPSRPIVSFGMT
ncbi:MAG: AAA15 family ATPase/GTPase, partial [Verrucomicrobiales bacterium]